MNTSKLLKTILSLLVAAPLLTACHSEDSDVAPDEARSANPEDLEGASYSITMDIHPDSETLRAMAHEIEGLGGDVHRAEVKLKKHDNGVEIEVLMHGVDLPGDDFADAMKSKFPELADATFSRGEVDPGDAPSPDPDISGDSPEVAEQKIIQKLKDDGVEGDIEVDVNDGPDGERSVEVKVKKVEDEG